MKRLIVVMFAAIALHSCKPDVEEIIPQTSIVPVLKEKADPVAVPAGNPLNKTDLDSYVINVLESKNDFKWEWMDLKTIWSALQYGDHQVSIGYKSTGEGDISSKIHKVNVKAGAYKKVHDALIKLILDELNKNASTQITLSEILVEDDPVLPILTVKITDKTVLTKIYNLENTRYLEPLGYWPSNADRGTSGCSVSNIALDTSDYIHITPSAIIPWNFNLVNIPAAWNSASGKNITISVIDAGLSSTQTLLGSLFASGLSSNRTITTDYTLGTSAYTSCGHGTSMSGYAVGPRNNRNAPAGVAYKSNLHFIHACDDVILDASAEKTAVKNALIKAGDLNNVNIISMSIGSPFSSSVLKDGVDYAYNKGKLIFAAAGTSFSWTTWFGVIYPAAYSSCVAVTGVKENNSTCSNCHDGSAVEFTVPMERDANSNRLSFSLKPNGMKGSYMGGSSCATATTAGIAALVWSARPAMARDQVIESLKNTAQYYPARNSTRGYGNIDAEAAVAFAKTHF